MQAISQGHHAQERWNGFLNHILNLEKQTSDSLFYFF